MALTGRADGRLDLPIELFEYHRDLTGIVTSKYRPFLVKLTSRIQYYHSTPYAPD